MKNKLINRIYFLSAIFLLLACWFVVQLYIIQVRDTTYWIEQAESLYVKTEKDIFRRGTIYVSPRIGNPLPVAINESGYTLAIDYRELKDHIETFKKIREILPSVDEELFFKYAHATPGWREIKKKVSPADAEKIRTLALKGVYVVKTEWRIYPYNDMMARTVGFVGESETDSIIKGKYGIERAYDAYLQRASVRKRTDLFAELFADITATTTDEDAEAADVITTIEPTTANMLRKALTSVHERYQSEITGGIVMNPKTGEVYAMDAVPSYNLNSRGGVSHDNFLDPNTLSLFEFGSIIKPLTMAMGIDAGVVSESTTYHDEGCITLNTKTVCNFDGRARGTVGMQEVLNQSLNMGVVFVQKLLGKERFRTYMENLRLGSETGIDAGGENAGNIRNLQTKYEINYATAAYGQGIATTPVGTIRALAALANEGSLPSPRLGKTLRFTDGSEQNIIFPPGEHVFKKETTETVSRMLTEVVDTALRYGSLKLEHYSVAAKTGTAFLTDGSGGYDTKRYMHSMFGYFPSHDPRFIVLLYTRDPQGVQYASETLAETFMILAKDLMDYYEITPDR